MRPVYYNCSMIRPCENIFSKSSYSFKARVASAPKFADNKSTSDIVQFSRVKNKNKHRMTNFGFALTSGVAWGLSRIKWDSLGIG